MRRPLRAAAPPFQPPLESSSSPHESSSSDQESSWASPAAPEPFAGMESFTFAKRPLSLPTKAEAGFSAGSPSSMTSYSASVSTLLAASFTVEPAGTGAITPES